MSLDKLTLTFTDRMRRPLEVFERTSERYGQSEDLAKWRTRITKETLARHPDAYVFASWRYGVRGEDGRPDQRRTQRSPHGDVRTAGL